MKSYKFIVLFFISILFFQCIENKKVKNEEKINIKTEKVIKPIVERSMSAERNQAGTN